MDNEGRGITKEGKYCVYYLEVIKRDDKIMLNFQFETFEEEKDADKFYQTLEPRKFEYSESDVGKKVRANI